MPNTNSGAEYEIRVEKSFNGSKLSLIGPAQFVRSYAQRKGWTFQPAGEGRLSTGHEWPESSLGDIFADEIRLEAGIV